MRLKAEAENTHGRDRFVSAGLGERPFLTKAVAWRPLGQGKQDRELSIGHYVKRANTQTTGSDEDRMQELQYL